MKHKIKTEPVPDFVWCDYHGVVHERSRDPYQNLSTEPECGPKNWRRLYMCQYDTPQSFNKFIKGSSRI